MRSLPPREDRAPAANTGRPAGDQPPAAAPEPQRWRVVLDALLPDDAEILERLALRRDRAD